MTQSAHAASLRVQEPWCMCRSLGSDLVLQSTSIALRPPKNMKLPRETRYTALCPNHSSLGCMPGTTPIHGISIIMGFA